MKTQENSGDCLSPTAMIDELAGLGPQERGEVAIALRRLSETFAEVADGNTISHALGVLAHLLDAT